MILGDGFDGSLQHFRHASEFRKWCAERGHKDHYIADRTQQESPAACLYRHSMAHASFERIGFPCLPIFHQFDGRYKSPLPDIPHMGQSPK